MPPSHLGKALLLVTTEGRQEDKGSFKNLIPEVWRTGQHNAILLREKENIPRLLNTHTRTHTERNRTYALQVPQISQTRFTTQLLPHRKKTDKEKPACHYQRRPGLLCFHTICKPSLQETQQYTGQQPHRDPAELSLSPNSTEPNHSKIHYWISFNHFPYTSFQDMSHSHIAARYMIWTVITCIWQSSAAIVPWLILPNLKGRLPSGGKKRTTSMRGGKTWYSLPPLSNTNGQLWKNSPVLPKKHAFPAQFIHWRMTKQQVLTVWPNNDMAATLGFITMKHHLVNWQHHWQMPHFTEDRRAEFSLPFELCFFSGGSKWLKTQRDS